MAITTTENDVRERLSIAYVTAVAARAGCQLVEPKVDRQGIDVTFSAITGTKAKIDAQIKATSSPKFSGTNLIFDLDVATYDKLRDTNIQSGQLLIVLALHTSSDHWLRVSSTSLIMKRHAYYINLLGAPSSINSATVRINLPISNRFDPDALSALMAAADARSKAGLVGLQ